jgi:catechol 2,3-dioxygenase-like lactoylglutathione lyase family enzyme
MTGQWPRMSLSSAHRFRKDMTANPHRPPAPRISEIVLRTSQFVTMRTWYALVLSADPSFEYGEEGAGANGDGRVMDFHRLCFLRLYAEFPYTQVLALFEIPKLRGSSGDSCGLHHMQFRTASLDELADRYELLRGQQIRPYQSFNHGPAISFYYEDPDRNLVEISAPCFETQNDYLEFFKSPGYKANPTGVAIEADQFVTALRRGDDRRELVRMPS